MKNDRSTRILAVANQKGGVGKTTTAVNLATALAAARRAVLVVDLDPQGNASTGFAAQAATNEPTSYDMVVNDHPLIECVKKTAIPGLDVIPSSPNLAAAEIEMVDVQDREFRLSGTLRSAVGKYDYIIIDCPPALGLMTLNALTTAQSVLVPLQCEYYALEGLSQLINTITRVQKNLNPGLNLQGIILTMFDKRSNLSSLVESDVREHMGDLVFKTVIPRNVRISEAPSHGKPVLLYDMRSTGAQAYIRLASEVLKRDKEFAREQRLKQA